MASNETQRYRVHGFEDTGNDWYTETHYSSHATEGEAQQIAYGLTHTDDDDGISMCTFAHVHDIATNRIVNGYYAS